ncbi:hypothetical protein BDAG_01675 [Burkholderia dolosa AU0158]|nr:hypothetical protein BDAG_01675 [Burkholderia dolosa AU0158]
MRFSEPGAMELERQRRCPDVVAIDPRVVAGPRRTPERLPFIHHGWPDPVLRRLHTRTGRADGRYS